MPAYKNLGGTHVQNDKDGKEITVLKDGVVETDLELDKLTNGKFVRLAEAPKPVRKRLKDHTTEELLQFAKDAGFSDVANASRDELIEALKAEGF